MANIRDISQLAVEAVSLTKTMGIDRNGTQPAPAGGTSTPSPQGAAMSAMFAVAAGGTTPNPSALNSIASAIAGGASGGNVAGAITGVTAYSATLSGAASFFENISGNRLTAGTAFSDAAMAELANYSFAAATKDLDLDQYLGAFTGVGALSNPLAGQEAETEEVPTDWVFITTPQGISWDKQGETALVNTYGSNSPYVIYSTTGMRKLSLSDCLIEGFSAGREVEDHVLKLEKLMTMVMNTQKGYVSPYVWDLRANDKSYGHFIIESMNIKEDMRNEKGRADRATASISLQQVPEFQINDGRDLATKVDLASGTSIVEDKDKEAAKADAAAKNAGSKVKKGDKPTNPQNPDKPPRPSALPQEK